MAVVEATVVGDAARRLVEVPLVKRLGVAPKGQLAKAALDDDWTGASIAGAILLIGGDGGGAASGLATGAVASGGAPAGSVGGSANARLLANRNTVDNAAA